MALLALPPLALWGYKDGPPPNMAGGFGGATCHMCHEGNAVNAPGGSLTIEGLTGTYTPGATYSLTITLKRGGLRSGGFQLAARFAGGEPAGLWSADGVRARIAPGGFVQHTERGTEAPSEGANQWIVEWTAPAAGEVVFHAAGNASNDDASALGDFVYTAERRTASK